MSDRATVSDPLPAARGAHHVGLSVADLPAMIAFYRDGLGFSVEVAFELPGGRAAGAMLRRPDGAGLELLCHADSAGEAAPDPPAAMLQRGYGHWALAVTEVGLTHARLLAVGAREVWSPRPAPPPATGLMSFLADPEGNLLELVEITDGPPS
jgi:catechol 2,3-dioxygenase-like lactoylglutathione lyase family enzyme